MEKLKDTVFKLAASKSTSPLTPSQIAFIEKGILDTFSSFKTPTHPPYDWMIQHAVKDLAKVDSLTTEEIISEYMIKTYDGLPWAHKRYLKHHLDILCKNKELYCDINGCYIHGEQKDKISSGRKRLKRKFGGKREGNVVVVENLDREELNELSDSQVGFQEEAPQGLGRGKRRRRRSYVLDDEEEDEVVETRIVVGERNRHKGSEMVVRETQNEVLLLKGGEVESKSSETHNDDHVNVDIAEGNFEPQLDIECTNNLKNQVVQVDHVVSEGVRKGPALPVLPVNMINILPVVTEDEVMKLDHSDSANAMLGTFVSVGDPLASMPNIKNDTTGSSVNELMIVPYVENPVSSTVSKQMIPLSKSVDHSIICGLPCKQLMTTKKLHVYQQRKNSKLTQEKDEVMEDEPLLASLTSSVQKSLMMKLKRKLQSPKFKGLTLHEDVLDQKFQKQQNSDSISVEVVSIEDEEPLRQALEKCGGWKKHGKHRTMVIVTSEDLASSETVAQLPDELPSLENYVAPTMEIESALSHEKSCDYVEDDTSRKSSNFLEEAGMKCSEMSAKQQLVVAQLPTGCKPESVNEKHKQQQQTQDSCDLELTESLTSSTVGGPEQLESTDTYIAMTSIVEKDLALSPEKTCDYVEEDITVEKDPALSPMKTCDYVEEDTSRKSLSSFLDKAGTKVSERSDNQQPVNPQLTTGFLPDYVDVKHKQEQDTQDFCDSGLITEGLAQSKADLHLPEELQSSETVVQMISTVEKGSALLPEKSCDYVEKDTSGKSSSYLEDTGTEGSEKPDHQQPVIAQLTTSCHPDSVIVKHKQDQQTQDPCDLELIPEGLASSKVGESEELRSSKNFVKLTSTMEKHPALSAEKTSSSFLEETGTDGSKRPDYQPHVIAQLTTCCQPDPVSVKHQQEQQTPDLSDSEQVTDNLDLQPTRNSIPKPQILGLESPSTEVLSLCPTQIQLKINDHNSQATTGILELGIKSVLDVGCHSLTEGQKLKLPEKPSKTKEATVELPTPLLVEHHQLFEYQLKENEGPSLHELRAPPVSTFGCQENKEEVELLERLSEVTLFKHPVQPNEELKASQPKKRGRPRMNLTSLQVQEGGTRLSTSQEQSKQKKKSVNQDEPARTRKKKPKKDAVDLSDSEPTAAPVPKDLYKLHLLEQEGLAPTTGEHLDQQNKHLQEDGREICTKLTEAMDAVILLNIQPKQAEPATPRLRGRPPKNKNIVTEEHSTPLDHQAEVGLSELVKNQQSQQQNKELRRGKSPKEMSTKSAPVHVPLSSKDQLRSRMKHQMQDTV